jgi:hypothetical protein
MIASGIAKQFQDLDKLSAALAAESVTALGVLGNVQFNDNVIRAFFPADQVALW